MGYPDIIQYFLPVNQCSRHHQWLTWSTWLQSRWTPRYELASCPAAAQELSNSLFSGFQWGSSATDASSTRITSSGSLTSRQVKSNITPDLTWDRRCFLKRVLRGDYSEVLSVLYPLNMELPCFYRGLYCACAHRSVTIGWCEAHFKML